MRVLLVAALALLGAPTVGTAADAALDRGRLAPGTERYDQVQSGTSHAWSMAVAADHVYELRVEQLGQNLTLALELGNGATRRLDDRRGWSGVESLWWISPATGAAVLRIATATERAGRYRVELLSPRAANEEDRRRDAAEMQTAHARDTDAAADWRAAAQAFATLGLRQREVVALFKLSNAASNSGDEALFPEALDTAARCLEIAGQMDDGDAKAECLYARAGALWAAGRTDEAALPYEEAAAVYERRQEYGPMAVVLASLGTLLRGRGALEEAQARLERAIPRLDQDGNHYALAYALTDMAVVYGLHGLYSDSLAAFERAREEYRRAGDVAGDFGELQALANTGMVYGQLGDPDRALARLRESLDLAARRPASNDLRAFAAWVHAAVGGIYEDLEDDAAAAAEYRLALDGAKDTAGWQGVVGEAAGNLGAVEARLGNFAAAEAHFDASLAQASVFRDQPRVARTRLKQARARIRAGRLDEAEAPLAQAQETFVRVGLVEEEAAAAIVRAELARARGDVSGALEHVTVALARIESIRGRVALLEQRAQYLGARRAAYDMAVSLLIDMDRRAPAGGHAARAFEMSERARARSLLDDDTRGAASGGLPAQAARRRGAFERIARLQRRVLTQRLSATPDAAAIAQLTRELDDAVAEEESARRSLRGHEARAEDLAEPPIVSAAAAAEALAPDETLLEYHVGRKESWLFLLDRSGVRVFPMPSEKQLRQTVNALRASLVKPSLLGAAAYAASARAAFELLLAPALLGPRRRLRIVPDGPLWELPFEALVTAEGGTRWADLPYVVKRWPVVYEPSASVAALARGPANRAASPLLVAFAAPTLPTGRLSGAAAATMERAVLGDGERWSLPPLPCADREARAVARGLGQGRAKVFSGAQAQEARVKRDADVTRARYLLFSTHGIISERLPSQSALVLALPGADGEDGLLQAYEIADLQLSARLVVLSACDSALGRNVKGEGLLGLARAFVQAGAGGLVASLWKVGDCSTAELVQILFRGLESPTGPRPAPEALRNAKLEPSPQWSVCAPLLLGSLRPPGGRRTVSRSDSSALQDAARGDPLLPGLVRGFRCQAMGTDSAAGRRLTLAGRPTTE